MRGLSEHEPGVGVAVEVHDGHERLADDGPPLDLHVAVEAHVREQFDAAEALLKEIQVETNAVRLAVEEQKEKVDKATQEVETVVKAMRENEGKARDELREIRDEVQNIRDMLPKVLSTVILRFFRFHPGS